MREKIGDSYKGGTVVGWHLTGFDEITRVVYEDGTEGGHRMDFVKRISAEVALQAEGAQPSE